jgi:hypothetical protein
MWDSWNDFDASGTFIRWDKKISASGSEMFFHP